jgi:hypothetical protein
MITYSDPYNPDEEGSEDTVPTKKAATTAAKGKGKGQSLNGNHRSALTYP